MVEYCGRQAILLNKICRFPKHARRYDERADALESSLQIECDKGLILDYEDRAPNKGAFHRRPLRSKTCTT
jgi:hypothetical protein